MKTKAIAPLVVSLLAFAAGTQSVAADVTQTTGNGSPCSPAQNGSGNTVICNAHPSDRLWLAVDGLSLIGDLFISDDFTPAFIFSVQVRVTGDQPAQKIAGLGLLLPFDGDEGKLLETQKERCDRAINAPIPQGSTRISLTLMPGQSTSKGLSR
jgi:hypothetical protein